MKKNVSQIEIRQEKPEDYKESEFVTLKAFWNRYAPGCNEFLLVRKVRKLNDYLSELSRVAVQDGKIVGLIMYSKAFIHYGDVIHNIVTFGPLCVDRSAQDSGVGAKLLESTIPLCKAAGYDAIVIFGEPNYYPKHGFVTCDHLDLTTMDGSNFDAFMGLELKPGVLSSLAKKYGCKGKFSINEAFDNLPDDETEAMRKEFPEFPKLKLPGQWGYPNPNYEKDGYQVLEAVQLKPAFINLFSIYTNELAKDNPDLANQISMQGNYLEEKVASFFADPATKAYVILGKDNPENCALEGCVESSIRPIGLFVVSGTKNSFTIDELFVSSPYRNKGIATNLVNLLTSQIELPCKVNVSKTNKAAIKFWNKFNTISKSIF